MIRPLFAVLIPAVCFLPLKKIYDLQNAPVEVIFDKEADGAFLRHIHQTKPDLHELTILKAESEVQHFDQILFYKRAYELDFGLHTQIQSDLKSIDPGTIVLTTQQPFKDSLVAAYETELLEQWYQGSLYRVGARK